MIRGIFGAGGSDGKMMKLQIEGFYHLNSATHISRMIK
jgi:hypothetical protein